MDNYISNETHNALQAIMNAAMNPKPARATRFDQGASMQVTLVSTSLGDNPDAITRVLLLKAGEIVHIGRASSKSNKDRMASSTNAVFDCAVMSRQHAQLLAPKGWPGPLCIVDKGSMHGTFVNGVRLAPDVQKTLFSGDLIKFGETLKRGKNQATDIPCIVVQTLLNIGPNNSSIDKQPKGTYSLEYSDFEEMSDDGDDDDAVQTITGEPAVKKGFTASLMPLQEFAEEEIDDAYPSDEELVDNDIHVDVDDFSDDSRSDLGSQISYSSENNYGFDDGESHISEASPASSMYRLTEAEVAARSTEPKTYNNESNIQSMSSWDMDSIYATSNPDNTQAVQGQCGTGRSSFLKDILNPYPALADSNIVIPPAGPSANAIVTSNQPTVDVRSTEELVDVCAAWRAHAAEEERRHQIENLSMTNEEAIALGNAFRADPDWQRQCKENEAKDREAHKFCIHPLELGAEVEKVVTVANDIPMSMADLVRAENAVIKTTPVQGEGKKRKWDDGPSEVQEQEVIDLTADGVGTPAVNVAERVEGPPARRQKTFAAGLALGMATGMVGACALLASDAMTSFLGVVPGAVV